MVEPVPRTSIPNEWALKSHCPVCGAAPLKIQREPMLPDCMYCSVCATGFLVEQGGSRIYFIDLPAGLADHIEKWMTFNEASGIGRLAPFVPPKPPPASAQPVDVAQPPPQETADQSQAELESRLQVFAAPAVDARPAPAEALPPEVTVSQPDLRAQAPAIEDLSSEALWDKAAKLYALGNSMARIEAILKEGGNVDPQRLGIALAGLEKLEEEKLARQKRTMKIAGGVALGLLFCILAVVAVSFLLR